MSCPNCENKRVAVIVYGYCEDENGNEYPFDPRVYETGGSLPAWGIEEEYNGCYHGGKWPTRFCYECRARFSYAPEDNALHTSYEEAIRLANEEWGKIDEKQLCQK